MVRLILLFSIFGCAPALGAAIDQLQTLEDMGPNKIPNQGTSHVLVIPSRVADSFPSDRLAELESYFASEGGPGTFRDYWQKVSLGKYDPIPTLAQPVLFAECPFETAGTECKISLSDLGSVNQMIALALERARDEQDLDLEQFDINGKDGLSDGYFDALVLDSDIYNGVALPVDAFGLGVEVFTAPDSGSVDPDAGVAENTIKAGIIAFIPPEAHEFAHLFGLVDQYNGPTSTGLMSITDGSYMITAYDRLKLGWSDVTTIDAPREIELESVLDSGEILQVGVAPQFILLENRGHAGHSDVEDIPHGLYIYSIDEDELPTGDLGFLDILGGGLYLANRGAPYLNVNLPFDCSDCDLNQGDASFHLEHLTTGATGLYITITDQKEDGKLNLTFSKKPLDLSVAPKPKGEPAPTCQGCESSSAAPIFYLVLMGLFLAWKPR